MLVIQLHCGILWVVNAIIVVVVLSSSLPTLTLIIAQILRIFMTCGFVLDFSPLCFIDLNSENVENGLPEVVALHNTLLAPTLAIILPSIFIILILHLATGYSMWLFIFSFICFPVFPTLIRLSFPFMLLRYGSLYPVLLKSIVSSCSSFFSSPSSFFRACDVLRDP